MKHSEEPCLEWFVLYVRTRFERAVESYLGEKGYETYCPVRRIEHQWKDRVKIGSAPLFPNYVFCRFDVRYRLPILVTPKVERIVGIGKEPTPIDAHEIEAVEHLLRVAPKVEPVTIADVGEAVMVTSGPLAGLQGTVLKVKNGCRLLVSISLLKRGIAAEVDWSAVKKFPGRAMSYPFGAAAHIERVKEAQA